MLVVTCRVDDVIYIGPDIKIRFSHQQGAQIKLAIEAPRTLRIDRRKNVPRADTVQEHIPVQRWWPSEENKQVLVGPRVWKALTEVVAKITDENGKFL